MPLKKQRTVSILSHSSRQTKRIGFSLGRAAQKGDVLCLYGPVGSGKTTFVQGYAKGLGIKTSVTSSSFVLVSSYNGKLPLYHVDFYRIPVTHSEDFLGLGEFLQRNAVVCIEWADNQNTLLPPERLDIYVDISGGRKGQRVLRFEPQGERWGNLLRSILNFELKSL